jgi:hypothetical protein
MARHILQLEHDPWPCKFIAECIAYQLGVKFSGNDEVTNLMREYGVFGLTVLELVNKSHVFSSDELKDSHALEKFYIQFHINGLEEQIDTLNELVTNLQPEILIYGFSSEEDSHAILVVCVRRLWTVLEEVSFMGLTGRESK